MGRLKRRALAAAALTAIAAPAIANDTSAQMAAGGLVFVRSPHVQMRSEDLFISVEKVRVRYRFYNNSAQDVVTRVAFPMPDVTIDGPDSNITIPTEDPQNLLGFTTLVDGKPVRAEVEQKAVSNGSGVDRTALLNSLGVPLAPHLGASADALNALPLAKRNELVTLGLAEIEEFDRGKGWEKAWSPRWTLKTTYHWNQMFPAGREISVEHRYTPATGGSAGTMLGMPQWAAEPEVKAMSARYCLDAGLLAGVEKARKAAKGDYVPLAEQRVSYILTTGANWAGPIGEFRLTVDKGKPQNMVSFCGEGVTKTSPTTFEMRKINYTPTRDLDVLILTPTGD